MALTQDRNTPMQDAQCVVIPVAAGVRIFTGWLVVTNAEGYAVPGKIGTDLAYAGRAEESVDNRSGGNGGMQILVRRGKAFKWSNDGTVTQAYQFKTVYVVDEETVSANDGGGTRSAAGLVVGIESDGVWVQ